MSSNIFQIFLGNEFMNRLCALYIFVLVTNGPYTIYSKDVSNDTSLTPKFRLFSHFIYGVAKYCFCIILIFLYLFLYKTVYVNIVISY